MKLMRKIIQLIELQVLAVMLAASSTVVANDTVNSFDFIDQQKLNSRLIVNVFMANVNQGKIDLFGHILKETELGQREVAYIHHFNDDSVSICIHFMMNIKLLVPHFEHYYVESISVDIDKLGKIEKIRTHIKPVKE